MRSSRLVPCPACTRHVRTSEGACPFCSETLPESVRSAPAPRRPPARLSRNALYVFGATTLTLAAAVACGDGTTTGDGSKEAGGSDVANNDDTLGGTLYGSPAFDSGSDTASDTTPSPDGGADGGSPEDGQSVDTGTDGSADTSADAPSLEAGRDAGHFHFDSGFSHEGGVHPVYGAAPP